MRDHCSRMRGGRSSRMMSHCSRMRGCGSGMRDHCSRVRDRCSRMGDCRSRMRGGLLWSRRPPLQSEGPQLQNGRLPLWNEEPPFQNEGPLFQDEGFKESPFILFVPFSSLQFLNLCIPVNLKKREKPIFLSVMENSIQAARSGSFHQSFISPFLKGNWLFKITDLWH